MCGAWSRRARHLTLTAPSGLALRLRARRKDPARVSRRCWTSWVQASSPRTWHINASHRCQAHNDDQTAKKHQPSSRWPQHHATSIRNQDDGQEQLAGFSSQAYGVGVGKAVAMQGVWRGSERKHSGRPNKNHLPHQATPAHACNVYASTKHAPMVHPARAVYCACAVRSRAHCTATSVPAASI